MKPLILLCLMLLRIQVAQATHLLGGHIQAKPVTGSSLTYEITVVVYMYAGSATDQTINLPVCFDDGSPVGAASFMSSQLLSGDKSVTIRQYRLFHTFLGPGTYTLTTSLSNRTPAENNTDRTTQGPLTLTTTFSTNAIGNRTPLLSIPETGFRVGINQRIVFPLKATDADGDSLVYGLANPLTSNLTDQCSRQRISSYQFPNDVRRQGIFKLNNRTGDLVWDMPTKLGYYSIAITVEEYRTGNLISRTLQEIPLIVDDLPGVVSSIPAYEPAIEGAVGLVITATTPGVDTDINLTSFPNPVDDHLQVRIQTSNLTTATLQLLDVNSRKLYELTFSKASRQHEQLISLANLAPGVYLLQAQVAGRSLVRKIVKK